MSFWSRQTTLEDGRPIAEAAHSDEDAASVASDAASLGDPEVRLWEVEAGKGEVLAARLLLAGLPFGFNFSRYMMTSPTNLQQVTPLGRCYQSDLKGKAKAMETDALPNTSHPRHRQSLASRFDQNATPLNPEGLRELEGSFGIYPTSEHGT